MKKLESICPLTLRTAKSNVYFIATCNISVAVVFLSIHMTPMWQITKKLKENHAVYDGTKMSPHNISKLNKIT